MARKYQNMKQRSNGKYELRFTVDGKRYSVYGDSPTECKAKEIQKRQDIAEGITGNNCTVDSYFKEFERQKLQTVKATTVRDYRMAYDGRIKQYLGNMRLRNVERKHVLDLQKTLAKSHTAVSVNYSMMVLSAVMKSAVIDGIITKNPCKNIAKLRVEKTEKQARDTIHRALTLDETNQFLNEASSDWMYELFAFLFTTGCRIGEAGALRWSDIDYANNCIHINRTITHSIDGKRSEGEPKTKTSKRDIPLMAITKSVLEAQQEKVQARGWKQSETDHVFLTVGGNLIDSEIVNIKINVLLKKLSKQKIEIEHFSVHATRDTFATRCVESGMNMNTLKTILGHSSLAMTADLYAHVLPNTKQKEMLMVNTGIVETAQRAIA